MDTRVWKVACATLAASAVLVSCTAEEPAPRRTQATSEPAPTSPSPPPADYEVDRVLEDVDYLAEEIGPRHATSDAYAEAADWVESRFESLDYEVERMDVEAPQGNTWGVDVPAGNSPNVMAQTPDFDPSEPHAVIGAHLDTIPVAPGAEDNASGVAVMLELARIGVAEGLPVRFVAFGAEEPRGPGDDLHHFGSQAYVASLEGDARDAMTAMVSLDRVGVNGPEVPICTGGRGTTDIRDELRDAAEDTDTDHRVCGDNRTSDHWSFEREDLPSARLGSIPYDGYHSERDTPDMVDRGQLDRVGTIMTEWMRTD